MATKTTTRIRRDLRRRLGLLAESKGTALHVEIEAALVRHVELPENKEHLIAGYKRALDGGEADK